LVLYVVVEIVHVEFETSLFLVFDLFWIFDEHFFTDVVALLELLIEILGQTVKYRSDHKVNNLDSCEYN